MTDPDQPPLPPPPPRPPGPAGANGHGRHPATGAPADVPRANLITSDSHQAWTGLRFVSLGAIGAEGHAEPQPAPADPAPADPALAESHRIQLLSPLQERAETAHQEAAPPAGPDPTAPPREYHDAPSRTKDRDPARPNGETNRPGLSPRQAYLARADSGGDGAREERTQSGTGIAADFPQYAGFAYDGAATVGEAACRVASVRSRLWDGGYRPIPVASAGKAPVGKNWHERARRNPPEAVGAAVDAGAANTGILCDGLRAIDVDIDASAAAAAVCALAIARFGETLVRYRENSPRVLLLYRATAGEPTKRALSGRLGKVEALGRGQQFVCAGLHPSGAPLLWTESPEQFPRALLPALSETDLDAFFAECAALIGADATALQRALRKRTPHANGHDGTAQPSTASRHGPHADLLKVAAWINNIPNTGPPGWEWWNRAGMAIWRATEGAEAGRAMWLEWSARNAAYDPAAADERWSHYTASPPSELGAGSLAFLAREATEPPPPSPHDYGAQPAPQPPATTPAPAPPAAPDHHEESSPVPDAPRDNVVPIRQPADTLLADDAAWIESELPTRAWIAPGYLMRGAITLLTGSGAVGKSTLAKAWAVSCALGMPFGRFAPIGKLRVISYNCEDDLDEERRRISATLRQFGATPNDIAGKIRRLSPRHVGTLVQRDRNTERLSLTQNMENLIRHIEEFAADVVVLDPLVELHDENEVDNTALKAIITRLRDIAREHNFALVLVHHHRKGAAASDGDPDLIRGATAIVNAARIAFMCANMTEDDVKKLGADIPESSRKFFFRTDNAKANFTPPTDAEWFERCAYILDNGENVAAAVPWTPPPSKAADLGELAALARAIEAGTDDGEPWSPAFSPTQPRSVSRLLEKHNFRSEKAQTAVVSRLKAEFNLQQARYRKANRNKALGLRIGVLPAADWA